MKRRRYRQSYGILCQMNVKAGVRQVTVEILLKRLHLILAGNETLAEHILFRISFAWDVKGGGTLRSDDPWKSRTKALCWYDQTDKRKWRIRGETPECSNRSACDNPIYWSSIKETNYRESNESLGGCNRWKKERWDSVVLQLWDDHCWSKEVKCSSIC